MKGEEKQIDEDVSLHKSQYFSIFSYITTCPVFAEFSVDKASCAYALSNYSS